MGGTVERRLSGAKLVYVEIDDSFFTVKVHVFAEALVFFKRFTGIRTDGISALSLGRWKRYDRTLKKENREIRYFCLGDGC